MKKALAATFLLVLGYYQIVGASESWTPYWAASAQGISNSDLEKTGTSVISSPDGKSKIIFKDDTLGVYRGGKELYDLTQLLGSVYLTEAVWSEDSKAFFLNVSDGGLIGTWSTHVYLLEGENIVQIPVSSITSEMGSITSNCTVNMGSIAWLNNHEQLLVLRQVPDTSGCSNMGKAVGYILDIRSERIVQTLTAAAIDARFSKDLGVQAKLAVRSK